MSAEILQFRPRRADAEPAPAMQILDNDTLVVAPDLNDCVPLGPGIATAWMPPLFGERQMMAALLLAEAAIEAARDHLGITDDDRPMHVPPSVVAKIDRAMRAIGGVKL